jgi:hypothetical protein
MSMNRSLPVSLLSILEEIVAYDFMEVCESAAQPCRALYPRTWQRNLSQRSEKMKTAFVTVFLLFGVSLLVLGWIEGHLAASSLLVVIFWTLSYFRFRQWGFPR